ncbi:MAG: aminotransferase class III-fold pyridoxal phosphate-dependent enzyme [Ilumatobacteraceae bacterium]
MTTPLVCSATVTGGCSLQCTRRCRRCRVSAASTRTRSSLAELMCERFGIERVRFTNSGTEANLMAIATAQRATGRRTVLVFDGGYHGGVLSFAAGPSPTNVPHRFVVAPYNDLAATRASIAQHGDDLACVVVEPMLGSGGCIPATAEFLRGVVESAGEVGAVCIADEVMTSRHGRRGLADLLGVRPDLTTYGKYLGGGFSFGAFGGSVDLMDQFDTARPSYLGHAGTFNNNVATMAGRTGRPRRSVHRRRRRGAHGAWRGVPR